MQFRKNRLITATALCAAAILSCTTMLGAADPAAFQTPLAMEEEVAAWTLDADGTLTISGDISDRTCPWKDQAEQIKKVVFTQKVYISFRENLFEGCVNLTTAVLSDEYSVRGGLFKDCTALTDVTIPEGVENISYGAFEGCTALKEIKFPESLSYISDEAFRGCTSLDNIVIPEKCYGFGEYAFADCTSLAHVEINGTMNVVARHVFENTPWLKAEQKKNPLVIVGNYLIDASACTGDVVLPDGLEGMGGAFADTPITSVSIPESVYNINADSFRNCTGLTEVKLPSELNALASNAFAGCTGLTHIEIPDSVTVFNGGVFQGCTNLKSVKLPNGEYPFAITKIEDSTFEGCSSLESIELPEALEQIGNSAFAGCEALKEITAPVKVRSIDSNAFKNCNLEKLTILDPLCTFTDYTFTDATIQKIVGYKGSSAEVAAETFGIEFEDLGMFVGGPVEEYGNLHSKSYMKILKPGDTFELGDGSGKYLANFFVTGTEAKIAEAEFEIENLENLSFTMDEFEYSIQESSLYEETAYHHFFYNNSKPVGIVNLTGKFTIKDTINANEEELRIVCTRLVDENGTDLLADTPDHKATLSYTIRMYSPSTPKPTNPTEPVTEQPTEAATDPTEAVTEQPTEPVTEQPTEAATDPTEAVTEQPTETVTEPETDPTEPATDPTLYETLDQKFGFKEPIIKAIDGVDKAINVSGVYTLSGPKVLDSSDENDAEVLLAIKADVLECVKNAVMEVEFNEENYLAQTLAIKQKAVEYYAEKGYDEKNGYSIVSLAIANMTIKDAETNPGTDPADFLLGDVNLDGVVNASDAAQVLIAAAAIGAGQDSGLTEIQKKAADVNTDGSTNATDAAIILQYAAAVGAGQKDVKITDFVRSSN